MSLKAKFTLASDLILVRVGIKAIKKAQQITAPFCPQQDMKYYNVIFSTSLKMSAVDFFTSAQL